MFFILVQSEQGDVFKITLETQAETVNVTLFLFCPEGTAAVDLMVVFDVLLVRS